MSSSFIPSRPPTEAAIHPRVSTREEESLALADGRAMGGRVEPGRDGGEARAKFIEIVDFKCIAAREPQHLACWGIEKGNPPLNFVGSNGNFRDHRQHVIARGRANWITRTSRVMTKSRGGCAIFRRTKQAIPSRSVPP